jgi:DNA-binding transcriptional LysR family regulator
MRQLADLATFAKVGALGSISAAGRALEMPKSSVSRAVTRLEKAYGARLIERTTRAVVLTEIGRRLHGHCLAMVDEVANAEAEVAAYQGHPAGLLKVAVHYTIGRHVIGPNLPEFLDRYPDLDLQLQLTDRPLNPITEGFDIGVRVGWLDDSSLIARRIVDIEAALVASRTYVERNGLPGTIADLEGHCVIGLPVSGAPRLELVRGRERAEVPIWRRFACNDPMLNMTLVRRGIAIAPVSKFFIAEPLAAGEIVRILPEYELHNPPALFAFYASRSAVTPKISVFLDFLTELAGRFRIDPGLFMRAESTIV